MTVHWLTRRGVLCGEFYSLSEQERMAALVTRDRELATCRGCRAVIPADDPAIPQVREMLARAFAGPPVEEDP